MPCLERWLHRPTTARVILIGSLLVTAMAWWAARHFAQDEARQRFERRTDDIQSRIERRMASYEAMLRGGVALFTAGQQVERAQWRRYVQTVQPEAHYPGIQGFGVARLIAPADLAAHEREVREQGFPTYQVRPPGPRDAYTSIVFLEPFVARNLRAFGFDMLSEPTRRAAMERARVTGHASVSGIVTLVQEDGKDVQRGFLMYMPVYRDAAGQFTAQLDPARLWGWVYAPFRVRDLMSGILGTDFGNIAFRIHEGPAGDAATAFYASDEARPQRRDRSDFVQRRPITVAGQVWTVVYEGRDFEAAGDAWQSNLVAVFGLLIDLMLYWSIATLARRKQWVEAEVERREAKVQARTQSLTAVSELSPNAVLVFERGSDGVHRLVFTNPAFSRWFGLHPDDLLGLSELAVDEWLGGLAHDGKSMPGLAGPDARLVLAGPPLRVLVRGMRESERQRVYYFRDITHESEIERLKNEFLSTAAHELRTPLASVYGFTELLLDDKLDAPRRARAVQIVHRQAGVLKNLVDELLDLARIDARRGADLRLRRIDLRRVVELACESMQKPGEVSRVHPQLGAVPMWVDADATKMQQAVVNLLSNALKYSKPPAAVSVNLHEAMRDGVRQVGLRVVDSGIGMTAEQCERAFERFFRADPSGHILGAGLGLAIVKEFVELQHGQVELRSHLGAGTQVTIWLPLREAPEPGHDAADTGIDSELQPA